MLLALAMLVNLVYLYHYLTNTLGALSAEEKIGYFLLSAVLSLGGYLTSIVIIILVLHDQGILDKPISSIASIFKDDKK